MFDFDAWIKKIEELLGEEIIAEEWVGYYDGGLSPDEAIKAEISIMSDNN
jgi:hypothetical protein